MGEISIDPKFNIHETYKKVRILNPYRNGSPGGGAFEPETDAYINTVNADGGVVVDPQYVDTFIKKAKVHGILGNLIHWTSSRAGMKKDANGRISKVYSLSGNNATQVLSAKQPLLITDGIQFAGNNEHLFLGSIDSTNPLSLYPSQQGSIEYCLKTNALGVDDSQRIIDKSTGGNGADGWGVFVEATGNDSHGSLANGVANISLTIISETSFTHIVSNFNSSFGGDIYKNGSFSETVANYSSIPAATAEMRIGAWNTDDRRDLEGILKDIRVWDIQLTATQASELNSLFI